MRRHSYKPQFNLLSQSSHLKAVKLMLLYVEIGIIVLVHKLIVQSLGSHLCAAYTLLDTFRKVLTNIGKTFYLLLFKTDIHYS